jgi:hypothetical protein
MRPLPKRDLLPSSRPDHITKALDESFERGYILGKSAGLDRALQLLRASGLQNIGDIVGELTRCKYE